MAYKETVYWNAEDFLRDGGTPTILAIGDSWFWYPMPGGSLINAIGDLFQRQKKIFVVGKNGALADDFIHGWLKSSIEHMFDMYGANAEALLISGGGNDFAGFKRCRPLFNKDCSNATEAEECFRSGGAATEGTMEWLLRRTMSSYTTLINFALERMPAGARVFIHDYDYPIATGIGFMGRTAWLQPAFEDAKIPDNLWKDCIKIIVDRHVDMFKALRESSPNIISFVDSTKTLTADQWANELHPTWQGFQKIANERWAPEMVRVGLLSR
jgi:hypothetical protein